MRILHLESAKTAGGQEYRTLIEAQWLKAAGHQVWIAGNPDSWIVEQGIAAKIPALPLEMRSSRSPLTTWKLYRMVRSLDCDLIHVHGRIDGWIAAPLRLIGVPIVRTRHLTNPIRPFNYRYGCDHLIVTAECTRKNLAKDYGIPLDRMTLVGEGADLTQFHPNTDGSSFRLLWGAQPEDFVFGCVAMLRHDKGQRFFIQAAVRICKQLPHARFVIIGDNAHATSSTRESYRELIREQFGYDAWQPGNCVRLSRETPLLMHGFASDVARATAALDVAVVPSTSEAQSRTAPEALCLGKPVIASNVGGLPEVVENEKTGLLVPPHNVEALAAAMVRLAENPLLYRKLATAAAEEGKKRFSFDARMEETLRVYEKVMGRGSH